MRGLDRLLHHDEIVALLRRTYADVGWEVPGILAELDNGSLYFEDIGQAKLATWSRGRVALLGDAAYGASLMSGMSTTLSITGAYVLAGELAGHDDPRAGLARYERVLRPLVARAQHLTPGILRVSHPGTAVEFAAFRALMRVASTPAAARLPGLTTTLFRPPADAITLPDYPTPHPAARP